MSLHFLLHCTIIYFFYLTEKPESKIKTRSHVVNPRYPLTAGAPKQHHQVWVYTAPKGKDVINVLSGATVSVF